MNQSKRFYTWNELSVWAKLLLVSSPIIGAAGFYWGSHLSIFLPLWVFLLVMPRPRLPADTVIKTDSILKYLSIEADALKVEDYQVQLEVVRQVAISEFDQGSGFLSFPLTSKLPQNYIFPIKEIQALRAWFEDNAPTIRVTT